MNIQRQIYIDRYLGMPVGILLNGIVRLVGKILRIDHSLDKPFKKIAVIKFKGLGSIIQATPMLKTLRLNYPDAEIIFISTIQNKALIELLYFVDRGIYLDDRSTFKLLTSLPIFIFKLIRFRIEVMFDLEVYSNMSSILCTLSCATNRFGYYLSANQYKMGLYTNMMLFNTQMPISQTYLQMARCLQITKESTSLNQFIDLNSGNIGEYIDLSKPFILINPNASELRIERRWGNDSFAKLIDQLSQNYNKYQIILVGGKNETKHVKGIIDRLSSSNNRVINLAGKTELNGLIWLISKADLFITCDTGPAHLAYGQNTKTIVLFGPVDPIQFDIPSNVLPIYKNLYCSPCVHEFDISPCKGDNQCMKMIDVSDVMQSVRTHLSEESPIKLDQGNKIFRKQNGKTLGQVGR